MSLMSNPWSSDKTQLGVNTLKTVLVIKVDYDETAVEFRRCFQQGKTSVRKFTSLKNTADLLVLIFKVRMTTISS
jgi:hypothetical protein